MGGCITEKKGSQEVWTENHYPSSEYISATLLQVDVHDWHKQPDARALLNDI